MNVRTLTSFLLVALFSVFVAGCGGGGSNQTQTETTTTESGSSASGQGELVATVNFDGEAPEPETYDASGNTECSKNTLESREVVVNDNGSLKNVVVAVKSGPSGLDRSTESPTVDQVDCMYEPHVTTAKVDQSITFDDSDPSMHNVRAIKKGGSQVFNITTFKGQGKTQSFGGPGVYSLECNVHPWMKGWVYVTDHGAASVTGENGQATLSELPAGDYTIEVWHEKFGSKTQSVTIEKGKTASLSVSYGS